MELRSVLALVQRVVAITVVVVLAACTSTGRDAGRPPVPDEDDPTVTEVTEPVPTPSRGTGQTENAADQVTEDEVVTALTSAGIVVLGADGSVAHPAVSPASGVSVTTDQVPNLLAEAVDGSGPTGAEIDAFGPTPIASAAFLAGYARGVDTPGALLSARLLAPQDLTHPEDVIFPALVTMLFASDLAHAFGDPSEDVLTPAAFTTTGLSAGGLCSEATEAIYRGINTIFDALHIKPVNVPKTGLAFLDKLLQGMANVVIAGINYIIEAGRTLVIAGVKFLIDTVLSVVAKVAALAAMVGNFVNWLSPLHVKVETPKDTYPKGVGANLVTVPATVRASIDVGLGDLDWPKPFSDCAHAAGVDLPPLKPVNEKVTWSLHAADPSLLRGSDEANAQGAVLQDGGPATATATWYLVTGTEPADAKGEEVRRPVTIRAEVQRSKVDELRRAVIAMGGKLIRDFLPPIIGDFLSNALTGLALKGSEGLVKLLSERGQTEVWVTYHDKDKPKPPKPDSKAQHEVWTGQWHNTGYGSDGTFTMDVRRSDTTMTGSIAIYNSGCVSGGQLTATVNGDQVQFGAIQAGHAINFQGQVKGNQVAGLWTIDEGCGGWSGTWQATIKRVR